MDKKKEVLTMDKKKEVLTMGKSVINNKVIERTFSVELEPGLNVKARLKRAGQQKPHEGDGVVVVATLMLPFEADTWSIDKRLRFRDRLIVGGQGLWDNWGTADKEEGVRYVMEHFIDDRWNKAFEKAYEWANGEINKIVEALTNRSVALEEAEND